MNDYDFVEDEELELEDGIRLPNVREEKHLVRVLHYDGGEMATIPYRRTFDDLMMADDVFLHLIIKIAEWIEAEGAKAEAEYLSAGGRAILARIFGDGQIRFEVEFRPDMEVF